MSGASCPEVEGSLDRGDRVFAEPWQAMAFALAVTLVRDGVVGGQEWADSLGAEVRGRPEDDYYAAWLDALEGVVQRRGLVDEAELRARRDAWEAAVLSTPHGQPIELA